MSNLIAAGAQKAGSPQEVLERAEIRDAVLPASPEVEGRLYSSWRPRRARAGGNRGTILIDTQQRLPSTPEGQLERRANQARPLNFLEEPWGSGGSPVYGAIGMATLARRSAPDGAGAGALRAR